MCASSEFNVVVVVVDFSFKTCKHYNSLTSLN